MLRNATVLTGTTNNGYLTDGTVTGLSMGGQRKGTLYVKSSAGTPTVLPYGTQKIRGSGLDDSVTESDKAPLRSSAISLSTTPVSIKIDAQHYKLYLYIADNAAGDTITAWFTPWSE